MCFKNKFGLSIQWLLWILVNGLALVPKSLMYTLCNFSHDFLHAKSICYAFSIMIHTRPKAKANVCEPQNIERVIILMMHAKVCQFHYSISSSSSLTALSWSGSCPLQHSLWNMIGPWFLLQPGLHSGLCPQWWNLVLVNSNQGNKEVSWDLVKHPCRFRMDLLSDVTVSSHGSNSDCSSAGWEVFKKPL